MKQRLGQRSAIGNLMLATVMLLPISFSSENKFVLDNNNIAFSEIYALNIALNDVDSI